MGEYEQNLTLIAAPVGEPLTLAEVFSHLRVPEDEDSDLIAAALTAARTFFDEQDARKLNSQTWQLSLQGFPCEIEIPFFPVQVINFVKYVDMDGVEHTLDPSTYVHYKVNELSRIRPAYLTYWPVARCFPDSVTIEFVVGYGDAVSTDDPLFDGTNYALAITPNWVVKFGVTEKTSAGFHINFDTAAPPDAEIQVLAEGGSPLVKLAQFSVAIDEDALAADIEFPQTLPTPSNITGGIPQHLKNALLLHIAHIYENREDTLVGSGMQAVSIPMGYQTLVGANRRIQI